MNLILLFFLIFICLTSVIASDNLNSSLVDDDDPDNPLVNHWSTEAEDRERMKEHARLKFSQHYHYFANVSENATKRLPVRAQQFRRRRRRELGASVAMAVVSGMIGMTSNAVSDLTTFRSPPSSGGCMWFGTAPLCNYPCPSDYDYIRPHNGRCSTFWFSSLCKPDPSFGEACSTILGSYFKKRFCCKSDPNDCTWSGRWMGASTSHNNYCRYDNNVGICGELTCAVNHFEKKAHDSSVISGDHCDEVRMFNATGRATCGYIAWYDDNDELIDSWYKTS